MPESHKEDDVCLLDDEKVEHVEEGFDLAENVLDKSRELHEYLVRKRPTVTDYQRGLVDVHNALGLLYAATDRLTAAEDVFKQAITIQDTLVGEASEGPWIDRAAEYHANLAEVYKRTGRLIDAENLLNDEMRRAKGLVDQPFPEQPLLTGGNLLVSNN